VPAAVTVYGTLYRPAPVNDEYDAAAYVLGDDDRVSGYAVKYLITILNQNKLTL
jgi:hypothetical protein